MESETVSRSNGEFTEEFEGKTAHKIRVSDHITGLQYTNPSDSFVVEMDRFSHLTQKPNSGISRSLARKGSVKKTNHQNATNENSIIASSSSPRGLVAKTTSFWRLNPYFGFNRPNARKAEGRCVAASIAKGEDGRREGSATVASRHHLRPSPPSPPPVPAVASVNAAAESPIESAASHVTAGAAAADSSPALQPLNQITVVTGGDIIGSSQTERRNGDKKFGFRRLPSSSWTLHPRRILLFFATLSSMGTILLIYFTLSIGTKLGGDETVLN